MNRYLKALGLAVMAAFAMSAVAAASASAEETLGQLTSDGPVTLTGTELAGPNALTATFTEEASTVECNKTSYTGHKYDVTPHELITFETTVKTTTITPHYDECVVPGTTRTAVVDMNGCDYVFHVGKKEGEHTYAVTADVVCPAEEVINVTVFSSGGTKLCEVTIKPQTGLSGPHLTTDTANDDIRLHGTFTGIHAQRHGPFFSPCSDTHTINNAELHVDVTITGHDEVGDPTGVTITDTTI